jgi:hypothetical protein
MKPTWGSGHESGTNGASRHRPEQRGEYFGYVAVAGFACSKGGRANARHRGLRAALPWRVKFQGRPRPRKRSPNFFRSLAFG